MEWLQVGIAFRPSARSVDRFPVTGHAFPFVFFLNGQVSDADILIYPEMNRWHFAPSLSRHLAMRFGDDFLVQHCSDLTNWPWVSARLLRIWASTAPTSVALTRRWRRSRFSDLSHETYQVESPSRNAPRRARSNTLKDEDTSPGIHYSSLTMIASNGTWDVTVLR